MSTAEAANQFTEPSPSLLPLAVPAQAAEPGIELVPVDAPPLVDRVYEDYSHVLAPNLIHSSRDSQLGDLTTYVAQRVHTQVYLEAGYITPSDLDERGLYTQYAERSTYFYTANDKREATVRQVECGREGLLTLPTLHEFEIDPEALKASAGVRRVADIKPKSIVEISALATRPIEAGGKARADFQAVLQLYTEMLRNSLEQGHEYWVLNTYDALASRLKILIGDDQMQAIGESRDYLGSETKPYLIKPGDVIRNILKPGEKFAMHRGYLKQQFAGVDDSKIPKDIKELLEQNEIETNSPSRLERIRGNKKAWAMFGLGAYCTARALPFGGIEQFEGSTAALWAIDIGTVPTYVKGIEMGLFGRSLGSRAVGYSMATASFAAPYIYAYAEGNDYPPVINATIGTIAGACAVKEVVSQTLKSRSESHLTAGLARVGE